MNREPGCVQTVHSDPSAWMPPGRRRGPRLARRERRFRLDSGLHGAAGPAASLAPQRFRSRSQGFSARRTALAAVVAALPASTEEQASGIVRLRAGLRNTGRSRCVRGRCAPHARGRCRGRLPGPDSVAMDDFPPSADRRRDRRLRVDLERPAPPDTADQHLAGLRVGRPARQCQPRGHGAEYIAVGDQQASAKP